MPLGDVEETRGDEVAHLGGVVSPQPGGVTVEEAGQGVEDLADREVAVACPDQPGDHRVGLVRAAHPALLAEHDRLRVGLARRADLLAATDDAALLASRLTTRVDVRQESLGEPGAADPEAIVLRQQRGMRRARQADTVEAGLVGACDGDLSVGQILDALAQLLGEDAATLRRTRVDAVRELVADGFLGF